ncbi:hypothetical protein D3C78_1895350 [compost metagenome]
MPGIGFQAHGACEIPFLHQHVIAQVILEILDDYGTREGRVSSNEACRLQGAYDNGEE